MKYTIKNDFEGCILYLSDKKIKNILDVNKYGSWQPTTIYINMTLLECRYYLKVLYSIYGENPRQKNSFSIEII